MQNNHTRIKIFPIGQVTMVELVDAEILDEGTINEITTALMDLVEQNPPIQLLLSFHRVEHLSSSALGTLIRLNKRIEEQGGDLKLCRIKRPLYEIFEITNLVKLFDIYEDEKTALNSFSQ
jgi:anti-sigma B factor antagonist